jgi:hypothetical protein
MARHKHTLAAVAGLLQQKVGCLELHRCFWASSGRPQNIDSKQGIYHAYDILETKLAQIQL